jgi:phosphoenolpyruvate carboxykinase (GTP)
VNWFRKDEQGKFLWPGYGENVRVLKWIVERIKGTAQAVETPVGAIPARGSIELDGLDVTPAQLDAALAVDNNEWRQALEDLTGFYEQFGSRMPKKILEIHKQTLNKL